MLARVFSHTKNQFSNNSSSMLQVAKRGIYKAGSEPHVFVNKHTKVICQGMTGKHVSLIYKNVQY